MAEIERCPFCNSTAYWTSGRVEPLCYVVCRACDCLGPVMETRDEAIAAWNRRTPPPQAAGGEPVAEVIANPFYEPSPEHGGWSGVDRNVKWDTNYLDLPIGTKLYLHPPAVGKEWMERLASKWERLAERFYERGDDISRAEAASMRNDAKELREAAAQPAGGDQ